MYVCVYVCTCMRINKCVCVCACVCVCVCVCVCECVSVLCFDVSLCTHITCLYTGTPMAYCVRTRVCWLTTDLRRHCKHIVLLIALLDGTYLFFCVMYTETVCCVEALPRRLLPLRVRVADRSHSRVVGIACAAVCGRLPLQPRHHSPRLLRPPPSPHRCHRTEGREVRAEATSEWLCVFSCGCVVGKTLSDSAHSLIVNP